MCGSCSNEFVLILRTDGNHSTTYSAQRCLVAAVFERRSSDIGIDKAIELASAASYDSDESASEDCLYSSRYLNDTHVGNHMRQRTCRQIERFNRKAVLVELAVNDIDRPDHCMLAVVQPVGWVNA